MANIHLSNSLGRSFPLPFALQYTFELKFEKEINLSSFHNLLSNIFWAIAHSKSLGAYNSGNGGSISGDECRLALQKMNKDWSGDSVNDKRNRDAQKWKGEDSNRRLWKTVAADEPRRGSETGRTPAAPILWSAASTLDVRIDAHFTSDDVVITTEAFVEWDRERGEREREKEWAINIKTERF